MRMAFGAAAFAAIRRRVVSLCADIASRTHEASRRTREAVRDGRHRLKTGRPRGMPSSFVHPPLECSSGCSQAARRVHGLLYGYSLVYEEVRPKVETMAAALGYSKSTTYNATAELRRAGLLDVHERRGRDLRRVANRYEVHSPGERAPLMKSSPRTHGGEPPSKHQKTRTATGNGERNGKHEQPPGAQATQDKPGLAKARRRRQRPISEMVLAECLGLERFGMLKARFGEALADLRTVITDYGAHQESGTLVAACDALLRQSSIQNPAGYLHSVLRRQLGDREAVQAELSELMEQYKQAHAYGDPDEGALAEQLRSRGIKGEHARSSDGRAAKSQAAQRSERRDEALDADQSPSNRRSGGAVPLERILSDLRESNPQLAALVARDPFAQATG